MPDAANREDVAKANESDVYIPGETRRDETRLDEALFFFLDGRVVGRRANLRNAHASPSILLSLYDIKVTKTFVRRRICCAPST